MPGISTKFKRINPEELHTDQIVFVNININGISKDENCFVRAIVHEIFRSDSFSNEAGKISIHCSLMDNNHHFYMNETNLAVFDKTFH